jgi:23S rRNA pseudouridine2605 synthase
VKGRISDETIGKLKKGVWLSEGKTSAGSVEVLSRGYEESFVEITIREGLNRQVRRMLAKFGLSVKSLKRTHIGKLTARGLGVGSFRTLTTAEIAYLKKIKIS